MKNNKNQTFEQMNLVALKWLADRNPFEIAKNAGISYDAKIQVFSFTSMGIHITLTYPDFHITPQVSGWHYLLILHYLHLADGTPLTGREISFRQMPSGMVRGGGIDRKFEMAISSLKNLDETMLNEICIGLGGQKIHSNADISYRIPFLPRIPVTLNVWLPDDEFPTSGRLIIDSSIEHYFTIEDAVTMAEILIERITVPIECHSY